VIQLSIISNNKIRSIWEGQSDLFEHGTAAHLALENTATLFLEAGSALQIFLTGGRGLYP
jgi:hypothetical protein